MVTMGPGVSASRPGYRPTLKVTSRNIYLGADLMAVASAKSELELPTGDF